MADEVDLHMSWCQSQHGEGPHDGDCVLEFVAGADLTVTMAGIPCDSLNVTVDGLITSPDELATVVATLQQLAPAFAASQVEIDCDLHPQLHAEDEEELVCDSCRLGPSDDEGLWSTGGLGYDGPNRYLCGACCAASGIDTTRRR